MHKARYKSTKTLYVGTSAGSRLRSRGNERLKLNVDSGSRMISPVRVVLVAIGGRDGARDPPSFSGRISAWSQCRGNPDKMAPVRGRGWVALLARLYVIYKIRGCTMGRRAEDRVTLLSRSAKPPEHNIPDLVFLRSAARRPFPLLPSCIAHPPCLRGHERPNICPRSISLRWWPHGSLLPRFSREQRRKRRWFIIPASAWRASSGASGRNWES